MALRIINPVLALYHISQNFYKKKVKKDDLIQSTTFADRRSFHEDRYILKKRQLPKIYKQTVIPMF